MTLRALALAVVFGAAIPAIAQNFSGAIGSGIRTLQSQDALPPPLAQVGPTQPSGNPLPPTKHEEGPLPPEGPAGPERGAFEVLHSGHSDQTYPLVHITKGVEFTCRGYHCWADEMYGNRDTNIYTLHGDVRVEGRDESVFGETVQVDFENKTFVAEQSESTLKPKLTQGLKDNLYVKGARSFGGEKEVFGENTSSTTCSYPSPHFELISEKTDVRPGKRVIFRRVKLVVLHHVILKLPYLSIPIDERTYNNLPVAGRDSTAGWFVKTRYAAPLSGHATLQTRTDYFSKLGLGLGAGVKYDAPGVRGNVSLYTIQGAQSEYELLIQHRQSFKWGTLSLDSNYEDNNYLYSLGSKSLSTRGLVYIPQGRSSDRFTFLRTTSSTLSSNTLQQTFSLNDSRSWSPKLNTTLDLNFSDNTSSFTGGNPVHREQVDVNFRAIDDLQKAQARLDYVRSIPIGESTNFFSTSDVTPALTFLSDSKRLFGSQFDNHFPFQSQLSYGDYGDPVTKKRLTRMNFDFTFANSRARPSNHWNLSYQGEFNQGIYSDNTAQFILRESTQLTYAFKGNSRFNLSYNYLRPYGYTPLQIDRRGNSNNFLSDLSYSPSKRVTIGLATGYDFNLIKQHQPTPWQQVGIQSTYSIGKAFLVRAISTYDTGRHDFSSTRFDLKWTGKTTLLSLGAKYDGVRNKWAAANLYVDGLQLGRLRTSALLNYNGYTKQFDAMHYSFIYDLHCAEAVFQIIDNPAGFNGGRAFYFFVRLKAFPFDTPFGTGSRGQAIGTGTGRD